MNGQRLATGRWIGIPVLLLAAAGWAGGARAEAPDAEKQQVDRVLHEGITTAQSQIRAEFSFLPFAVVQHADGTIEQLLGPTGGELDPLDTPELEADPALALQQLQRRVKREAKARGDFTVVGIFSDADVKLPDGSDSDAIRAEVEHVSGYCTDVFVPYGRDGEQVIYGEEIREKGDGLVFRCR